MVVLAAGTSSRWGEDNKLLVAIDGRPMVRRTVDSVLAAGVGPVVVVTGHEARSVEAALTGLPVTFAQAAGYVQGMSASLKTGIAAAPADCAGALICLGDMPFVMVSTFRRLASFASEFASPLEGEVGPQDRVGGMAPPSRSDREGRESTPHPSTLCVADLPLKGGGASCVAVLPTFDGRRGNPVLLGRALFPEISSLSGDQGARRLLAQHAGQVLEIAVDDPGVLRDVDRPEALDG